MYVKQDVWPEKFGEGRLWAWKFPVGVQGKFRVGGRLNSGREAGKIQGGMREKFKVGSRKNSRWKQGNN